MRTCERIGPRRDFRGAWPLPRRGSTPAHLSTQSKAEQTQLLADLKARAAKEAGAFFQTRSRRRASFDPATRRPFVRLVDMLHENASWPPRSTTSRGVGATVRFLRKALSAEARPAEKPRLGLYGAHS